MTRKRRIKVRPFSSIAVAALGGLVAGGAELAAALPAYAHWIAVGMFVLASISNQLNAAIHMNDAQPQPLPLPPADNK